MPLTLILGPANSAKAGELLGAYSMASERDALLVVPTAADAAHYDRELAGSGAVLGRALTFAGLLEEIARRSGVRQRAMSALQRERLLRTTVARLELSALADSAATGGFGSSAGRLLDELVRLRISPQRFAEAMHAWGNAHPDARDRARDLAGLYTAYEEARRQTGLLHPGGLAWAALDALRRAPERWGGTPVFVYGFDDLTVTELDAVETLSRSCGARVAVSLTFEGGRAAFGARASLVETLRAEADAVRELPSLEEHYAPAAAAALHHLERNLFVDGAARVEAGDAVRLLEAGGELAEAEQVALQVVRSLREGVPPEEIVVVCRSLPRSGALLEGALARCGVSTWSARAMPLAHTSLGRAVLGLARCALLDGASAGDLLAYLRAPGISQPEDVDALESALARAGLADAASALARWSPLPELHRLREATDLLVELGTQAERIFEAPYRRLACTFGTAAELDARALAVLRRSLSELSSLPASGSDSAGRGAGPDSAHELLELLGGLAVPVHPPPSRAAAAVLVAEPLAIRARRFRVVLVAGLCEGEFPAPPAVEPFLDEDQRRELALSAGLVLPAPGDALSAERYLLYAALSRATDRVCLSFRSSDEEGNLVLPSPFVRDVGALFEPGWWERRGRRLLADVTWAPSEAPTAREYELAIAAAGGRASAAAGHGDRPAAGSAPPASGAEAAGRRTLGPVAMSHVRHREILSGGAIEGFANCPVAWLVERQLEPEELAPDSDAIVRGNFMHSVLERVIGELGGPLTAESLAEAERSVSQLMQTVPAEFAAGRPAAVRAAMLRGIEADLRRYLRHESRDGCEWRPMGTELGFGFQGEDPEALPPLVLGHGDDAVRVRGLIDRVDVGPDGRSAIVRDYKSGSNRPERAGARWLEGHQFQVALYMLAVRRLCGVEPVGGFYQPLTGRDLRPRGAYAAGAPVGDRAYPTDALDPGELEQLLAEIEAEVVDLAGRLARGELVPCPQTCSRDGCRHPGICWA